MRPRSSAGKTGIPSQAGQVMAADPAQLERGTKEGACRELRTRDILPERQGKLTGHLRGRELGRTMARPDQPCQDLDVEDPGRAERLLEKLPCRWRHAKQLGAAL